MALYLFPVPLLRRIDLSGQPRDAADHVEDELEASIVASLMGDILPKGRFSSMVVS